MGLSSTMKGMWFWILCHCCGKGQFLINYNPIANNYTKSKCTGKSFYWTNLDFIYQGVFTTTWQVSCIYTMIGTGRQKPNKNWKNPGPFLPSPAFFRMFFIMEVENRRTTFSGSKKMKHCVQLSGNMEASYVSAPTAINLMKNKFKNVLCVPISNLQTDFCNINVLWLMYEYSHRDPLN